MYRNNVRVYSSPLIWRQGFSPHPHLIVVETFGEGRAGFLPFRSMSCGTSNALRAKGRKAALKNNNPILGQIFGEGGLSN